jgi:hypothetical protein
VRSTVGAINSLKKEEREHLIYIIMSIIEYIAWMRLA